ncbi:MAG: hypothetical protein V1722_04540 [Candidatus Micrarchaeota archaeon]
MERIVKVIHDVVPVHSVEFHTVRLLGPHLKAPIKKHEFVLNLRLHPETDGAVVTRGVMPALKAAFGKNYSEISPGHCRIVLDSRTSKATEWVIGISPMNGAVRLRQTYLSNQRGPFENVKRTVRGRAMLTKLATLIGPAPKS